MVSLNIYPFYRYRERRWKYSRLATREQTARLGSFIACVWVGEKMGAHRYSSLSCPEGELERVIRAWWLLAWRTDRNHASWRVLIAWLQTFRTAEAAYWDMHSMVARQIFCCTNCAEETLPRFPIALLLRDGSATFLSQSQVKRFSAGWKKSGSVRPRLREDQGSLERKV